MRVSLRQRDNPLLEHLKRNFSFSAEDYDFGIGRNISVVFCSAESFTASPQSVITRMRHYTDINIAMMLLKPGTEEAINRLSMLAYGLGYSVIPVWSYPQAALFLDEAFRFFDNPETVYTAHNISLASNERMVALLEECGLNKPKIVTVCNKYSSLAELTRVSLPELAALEGFSTASAERFIARLNDAF